MKQREISFGIKVDNNTGVGPCSTCGLYASIWAGGV